jgi:hypothetical protein
MGTRGIHGFCYKGKLKITYNQYDMYPTGVGSDLVEELMEFSREDLIAAFKRIRMVKGNPSKANQERYRKIADLGVSKQETGDWYCLLRQCQGTLRPWVTGEVSWKSYDSEKGHKLHKVKLDKPVGHMLDASDFPTDSLFCEWGYIVNLDNNTFEVYQGSQKASHNSGRFAKLKVEQPEHRTSVYYPIKLVATFDLDNLPNSDVMARLQAMLYGEQDEDPSLPEIEGMSPRTVGKLAMGATLTYQDKSVERIEQVAPLYDSPEEPVTTAKDILADLRHYCDTCNLDFDALVRLSRHYYDDEVAEDKATIKATKRG